MLNRSLSFKEAVHLLGDEQEQIFDSLNKLLGGLLFEEATGSNLCTPGLLDDKDRFLALTQTLWNGLPERISKLGQLEKTRRISAVHSITLISSFIESIKRFDNRAPLLKIRLPGPRDSRSSLRQSNLVSPDEVWPDVPEAVTITLMRAYRRQLTAEKDLLKQKNPTYRQSGSQLEAELERLAQTALSRKKPKRDSTGFKSALEEMINSPLPLPAPQTPYEITLIQLGTFYEHLAELMRGEIVGPEWAKTETKEREGYAKALGQWVNRDAVAKYKIQFEKLTEQFPEVAFWANMANYQAVQHEIYEIRQDLQGLDQTPLGLKGLERALQGLAQVTEISDKRIGLANFYKKALDRPIVESREIPVGGMRIPDLGAAYINPNFRASDVDSSDAFYTESWWQQESRQARSDLQKFLFGHLKSPQAVCVPVLVLGQPGSGKSVLTKTIAARLPREEFFVVRVSLREVAAEADIQVQIEQAFYEASGDHISWPELVRGAGDVIPVVILDGFDELLQATGVSQSDYLERAAMFQEREHNNNRPCVVIITSRTAVADRARVPVGGMVVVRLEPFDESQISLWVSVWNEWNSGYFRDKNIKELQMSLVLKQGDLAKQPLLLLMLALYDADNNALGKYSSGLGQAQLYERLIVRFAERDVRKLYSNESDDQFQLQVERDLMRLSIAAIAMFNRSRQWVTHDELDGDLGVLMDRQPRSRRTTSVTTARNFQALRSPGEIVLGQFFFIHEARALVAGVKKGSFEFLHATFGEFLVARLVARELEDLVKSEEFTSNMARRDTVRDDFLYALLSFSPLSARATTIEFLRELLEMLPSDRRVLLRGLLLELLSSSLDTRGSRDFEAYEPVAMNLPARYATYSANLLIMTLLAGGEIRASELFGTSEDVVGEWSRLALLWRSQLSADGWQWLSDSIEIVRNGIGNSRDVTLRLLFSSQDFEIADQRTTDSDDLFWTFNLTPNADVYWSANGSAQQMFRRYKFTCSADDDILVHALKPIFDSLGVGITSIAGRSDSRSVSCAHAFLRLWILSVTRAPGGELAEAYDDCIDFCLRAELWMDSDAARTLRNMVIRQLRSDYQRLPGLWRSETSRDLQSLSHDYESEARSWIDALVTSLGLRG